MLLEDGEEEVGDLPAVELEGFGAGGAGLSVEIAGKVAE
jgi:hypothetical protein